MATPPAKWTQVPACVRPDCGGALDAFVRTNAATLTGLLVTHGVGLERSLGLSSKDEQADMFTNDPLVPSTAFAAACLALASFRLAAAGSVGLVHPSDVFAVANDGSEAVLSSGLSTVMRTNHTKWTILPFIHTEAKHYCALVLHKDGMEARSRAWQIDSIRGASSIDRAVCRLVESLGIIHLERLTPAAQVDMECGVMAILNVVSAIYVCTSGSTPVDFAHKLQEMWQFHSHLDFMDKTAFAQEWRICLNSIVPTLLSSPIQLDPNGGGNPFGFVFRIKSPHAASGQNKRSRASLPQKEQNGKSSMDDTEQTETVPHVSNLDLALEALHEDNGDSDLSGFAQVLGINAVELLASCEVQQFEAQHPNQVGISNAAAILRTCEASKAAIDLLTVSSFNVDHDTRKRHSTDIKDIAMRKVTMVESHRSKVHDLALAIRQLANPTPFVLLEAPTMDLLQSLLDILANEKWFKLVHIVFFVRDSAHLLSRYTGIAAFVHFYGTYLANRLHALYVSPFETTQTLLSKGGSSCTGRIVACTLRPISSNRFRQRAVLIGGYRIPPITSGFYVLVPNGKQSKFLGFIRNSAKTFKSGITFSTWLTGVCLPDTNERLRVYFVRVDAGAKRSICEDVAGNYKGEALVVDAQIKWDTAVLLKTTNETQTKQWLQSLGMRSFTSSDEPFALPIQASTCLFFNTLPEHWTRIHDTATALVDRYSHVPLHLNYRKGDDDVDIVDICSPEGAITAPWQGTLPEGFLFGGNLDALKAGLEGAFRPFGIHSVSRLSIETSDFGHSQTIFHLPLSQCALLESALKENGGQTVRLDVRIEGQKIGLQVSPHFDLTRPRNSNPIGGPPSGGHIGLALDAIRDNKEAQVTLRAAVPVRFIIRCDSSASSDQSERTRFSQSLLQVAPFSSHRDQASGARAQLSHGVRYSPQPGKIDFVTWAYQSCGPAQEPRVRSLCLAVHKAFGRDVQDMDAAVVLQSDGRSFSPKGIPDSIIVIFGRPRAVRTVRVHIGDDVFSLSVEADCAWVLASTYESWDRTTAQLLCDGGLRELVAIQSVLDSCQASITTNEPPLHIAKRHSLFQVLEDWVATLSADAPYAKCKGQDISDAVAKLRVSEKIGRNLVADSLLVILNASDYAVERLLLLHVPAMVSLVAAQLLGIHLHPPLLALVLERADIQETHAIVTAWQMRQSVSVQEYLKTTASEHLFPNLEQWQPTDHKPWIAAIEDLFHGTFSTDFARAHSFYDCPEDHTPHGSVEKNDKAVETRDQPMESEVITEGVRYVVSLSLFAGADTGRYALEFYLKQHNLLDSLVACVAIEKSAGVLECLRRIWTTSARPFPETPDPTIVHDVLDWLVDWGHPLRTFAESLPFRCVVVITIGSPCQDFNFLAKGKGKLGFFGSRSIFVFTAGLYVFILSKLRPDVVLVPVLENGGRMDAHFVNDMPRIVGLPRSKWLPVDVRGAFSPFPRKRYIGSPYQGATNRQHYSQFAESACEEGWFFPDQPATFMLPRPFEQGDPDPEEFPLPTFSQSHPAHLMKAANVPATQILAQCRFEQDVVESLQFVLRHHGSNEIPRQEFDSKARPWARHVALHGRSFGLRFPSGDERLRHVGLPFAVKALRTEREKFTLAGNAFHYLEIVSAFGVEDDCLANLLKGTAQPRSIQPMSPQDLVRLYQTSLASADLPADVAPWAHTTPFPYCTAYNQASDEQWGPLAGSEHGDVDETHTRRHIDLREVASRPGPTACRMQSTSHSFGEVFKEVSTYQPSMWVGSHTETEVFTSNQAISLLSLQILHRRTNRPNPVSVAQLFTLLQERHHLPFRNSLIEIQQDWSTVVKGCGEEQVDAILLYQGDISEDTVAINTKIAPLVLGGNRSRDKVDKRGAKYEVFAAVIHQPLGGHGIDRDPENEGFAVSLLKPIHPLMSMKISVPQPIYKPNLASSEYAAIYRTLFRWQLLCLPQHDMKDADPSVSVLRSLWGKAALLKWQRFLAAYGPHRQALLSSEFAQLPPHVRLHVVLSALHVASGDSTNIVVVSATDSTGFSMQVQSNGFLEEEHVLILLLPGECQTWVSLPKKVRTASLNTILSSFGKCSDFKAPPRPLYAFNAGAGRAADLNFVEKELST